MMYKITEIPYSGVAVQKSETRDQENRPSKYALDFMFLIDLSECLLNTLSRYSRHLCFNLSFKV
jgi:hypothetical protein